MAARCASRGDFRVSSLPTALAERASPHSSRLLRRSGQVALYCAHRTSTVLSCAFCEQEGHLAAPPLSLPAALAHPFKGGLVDFRMRASNEYVSIMLPPSLLVARSWKGTHVGLRAAVERGPS